MPFPTYAKQDEVPEAFRGEYEEREGVWVPKIPDVTKLSSALEKERAAKEEAERKRKAAEKERDELQRTQQAKASGVSEEALKKIREDEAAARKPIEDENVSLKAENRKLKLTDRVQALALKYGVMVDRIEDAMMSLDKRTDLGDANGIIVKDKDGKVTAETIDDFLKTTFKKEKPWLYAGSGAAGSGAQGSSGSGDNPPPAPKPEVQDARNRQIANAF